MLTEQEMLAVRKSDIEAQGWEVDEIDDHVFMIKNFLNVEDRKRIMDEVVTYGPEDWLGHYMDHLRDHAEREHGTRDIEQLNKDGKLEITWDWADKNLHLHTVRDLTEKLNRQVEDIIRPYDFLYYNGLGTIQRQYDGAELRVHVDNYTDPYVAYAAIIYVNDDYNGGELIFPTRNLELRVPAGAMMLFPGTADYPHGVKPPLAGPHRYVLPSFISMYNEQGLRRDGTRDGR
jgi:hypothetical protein